MSDIEDPEEETYGVSRDQFSVNPSLMEDKFKEELQTIVYVDLPADLDYAQRLREERAVMSTNDGVRGELLARDHAPGSVFPPLLSTRCVSIGERYAVAEEFRQNLSVEELAAENDALDEQVFQHRLQKITKKIQADNLIRELISRLRMELYMYPREHDRIRDWVKRAKEYRASLPDDETADDMAQTAQAHFQANQLLGLPLPPIKGEERPILQRSWTLGKDNVFRPKREKNVRACAEATKRRLWIATLPADGGLPHWNCFKSVVCNVYDVCDTDHQLVTVHCTAPVEYQGSTKDSVDHPHTITIVWQKIIASCMRVDGNLLVQKRVSFQDVKRCLGPPRFVRAFQGDRALIGFDQHTVLVSADGIQVNRYAHGMVSSATCMHDKRVVVGTSNGYLVDGNVTHNMPYRLPVLLLEHQGGGILLAATRMAIFRFHTNPEIGPYQLNVPCPMGVSGCGALMGSVSLTGNVWMSNTFAKQQLSRNINPPPGISEKIDLRDAKDKKKEDTKEDPDNPTSFWRLKYPFQYQYRAFWVGRLELHILYPDMSVRRLIFKSE